MRHGAVQDLCLPNRNSWRTAFRIDILFLSLAAGMAGLLAILRFIGSKKISWGDCLEVMLETIREGCTFWLVKMSFGDRTGDGYGWTHWYTIVGWQTIGRKRWLRSPGLIMRSKRMTLGSRE